ncbi:DUF4198 domain-containing protein [Phenylobacterium sp.]|uniref:DUF4198 domain-containing protein n=1 Tax=Phenylobacterium sp. TaxID=1871053 RepID=UPI00286C05C8|nr:DUF4198 domain-containing protein [Phenylobacterium sp.]
MISVRHGALAVLSAVAVLAIPAAASAHRQWLLPSSTVLSGNDPWITVDAAVSNELFYFDHNPMRLDSLTVTAPDGAKGEIKNGSTGKYRSTFDVQLDKPGTYKIGSASDGLMASYKLNGEQKRWRGAAAEAATAIPKEATEVKLTESSRRLEIFATRGAPTKEVLKLTGKGLEVDFVTHPNDLVVSEPAQFKLLLDGKPAAGVEVEVVPGGNRYRAATGEMKLTTDAQGAFTAKWPGAGMYWLEATVRGGKSTIANAERSASYVTTLEVLPD